MNSKTPQNLDPKLKETYDRVMGGNFNQTSSASKTPEIPKAETPVPVTAMPATPLPNPLSENIAPPTLRGPLPPPTALPEQPAIPAKKKFKISPIIYLIFGFILFVIYGLVWGKIFKLF